MYIEYEKDFIKQLAKLKLSIQRRMGERLNVFRQNRNSRILNVHKLNGKFADLYSMNITGDIRLIFHKINIDGILIVAIGTHSELYS